MPLNARVISSHSEREHQCCLLVRKRESAKKKKMLNKGRGMPLGGGTHQYLCTMCLQCPQRPEGAPDPLELELQMVLSRYVGAGNSTWIL